MARLNRMTEDERNHILSLPCPTFDTFPWVSGFPLAQRRVALITTAGLHDRNDLPFGVGAAEYRIIPADIPASALVMSHISTNFDRTGFQQDINVVFPLDRLRELVRDKVIGSMSDFHFSFMGATEPARLVTATLGLARILKRDGVDAVLLVPV